MPAPAGTVRRQSAVQEAYWRRYMEKQDACRRWRGVQPGSVTGDGALAPVTRVRPIGAWVRSSGTRGYLHLIAEAAAVWLDGEASFRVSVICGVPVARPFFVIEPDVDTFCEACLLGDADVAYVVYRAFAADDELLYVGYSSQVHRRIKQHRTQPWFAAAARWTVEHFPDAKTALSAESAAIRTESPLHNRPPGPQSV